MYGVVTENSALTCWASMVVCLSPTKFIDHHQLIRKVTKCKQKRYAAMVMYNNELILTKKYHCYNLSTLFFNNDDDPSNDLMMVIIIMI